MDHQQELKQLLDGVSEDLASVRREMSFPESVSDAVKLAHLVRATQGLFDVVSLQHSFIATITAHLTREPAAIEN